MSRQAISKWESGAGIPDIENLKAISVLFDVTLDSLLSDEKEIQETEEDFRWKFATVFGGIALGIGWFLEGILNSWGVDKVAFGIGAGIIGYFIGLLIGLLRKRTKS